MISSLGRFSLRSALNAKHFHSVGSHFLSDWLFIYYFFCNFAVTVSHSLISQFISLSFWVSRWLSLRVSASLSISVSERVVFCFWILRSADLGLGLLASGFDFLGLNFLFVACVVKLSVLGVFPEFRLPCPNACFRP